MQGYFKPYDKQSQLLQIKSFNDEIILNFKSLQMFLQWKLYWIHNSMTYTLKIVEPLQTPPCNVQITTQIVKQHM
jgi:actin-related protein